MAVNVLQTNNIDKINNKRLALIQIVKIDLNTGNNSETDDDGVVYSPAYISTTNTCVVNSGTASQGIQFQLLGKLIIFLIVGNYESILFIFSLIL